MAHSESMLTEFKSGKMLDLLREDLKKKTGNHFLTATILLQWLEWVE